MEHSGLAQTVCVCAHKKMLNRTSFGGCAGKRLHTKLDNTNHQSPPNISRDL